MDIFCFKGFTPSDTLRLKADQALDRIIEKAPSDAKVTAAVEQDGEMFHCHIEIGSLSCPLVIETSHKFAGIAIDKAELNLMRKLERWRGSRFHNLENAPLRTSFRSAT